MRPLYLTVCFARAGLIAGLFMLAACEGGGQIPGGQALDSNVKGSIQGSFLVESLQPSAAGPGSELVLRGAGMTAGMAVLIAGVPAKILGWDGDHTVRVEVPTGSPGMQTVTVQKNGETASLSFLRLAGDGEAMVTGSLALVCKGQASTTSKARSSRARANATRRPPRTRSARSRSRRDPSRERISSPARSAATRSLRAR